MEHFKKDKRTKPKHGRYSNVEETEYHFVDSQQEALDVQIGPARPLLSDSEYADRDVPRSLFSTSICSNPRESPINHSLPKTGQPRNSGPAVNRHLKPGRRRPPLVVADGTTQSKEEIKQSMELPGSSHQSLSNGLANQMSKMELLTPSTSKASRGHPNVLCNISSKAFQFSEREINNTQRHSLDLEFQQHPVMRLAPGHSVPAETPSPKYHHEWPPTKVDIERHVFVSVKKPIQTYTEKDWYIGACERAEAEHALHLVNKDGAFLVRNCSANSPSEPYVLAVFYKNRVYNVKIRYIISTCKYSLGQGQRSNDMFDSVADIITFHSLFPISLIDGRNRSTFQKNCVLRYPITKDDMCQLNIKCSA